MLIPDAILLTGRNSETSDIARGPEHPMPTPCSNRTQNSAGTDGALPYPMSDKPMSVCAMSSSRFFEKLSKAGPANGRTSNAVMANAPTTMPTIDVAAPNASKYNGRVVVVMNAAMLWKKFVAMSATYGALHMLSFSLMVPAY